MKPKITESKQKKLPVVPGKTKQPLAAQTDNKVTKRVWLDADVIAWLKSQGDGYQTRMSAILRREMLAAVRAGKA